MSPSHAIWCFSLISHHIVLLTYAFRSDYTFVETTKSFYKYHKDGGGWDDAIAKCKTEGGQLFYPDNEFEVAQAISVLKIKNNLVYDVMIGISDLRKNGVYETADGRPASEVYKNWRKGEPNSGPKNEYHCAYVDVKHGSHKLFLYYCDPFYQPYICKNKQSNDDLASTEISEIHPIHKGIEELVKLYAAASERQTAALERQAEAMQRQASALERLANIPR